MDEKETMAYETGLVKARAELDQVIKKALDSGFEQLKADKPKATLIGDLRVAFAVGKGDYIASRTNIRISDVKNADPETIAQVKAAIVEGRQSPTH